MKEPLSREGATLLADFKLDRESGEPVYQQLCDFLRRSVRSGELPVGSKLPSTRALARRLRVSRHTVLNAYESLVIEGVLEGKVGSGTVVRGKPKPPKTLNARRLLKESHYPSDRTPLSDPDGNPVYIHR